MTKTFAAIVSFALFFSSCNNSIQKGKFAVIGKLENAADQKIYLDELYFTQKETVIVDSGEVKNGAFRLSALSPEEGLYRLRLEKNDAVFILINDKPEIPFSANTNNLSFETAVFNSPANQELRKFMLTIDAQRKSLEEKSSMLQQYKNTAGNDSGITALQREFSEEEGLHKNYILKQVDTTRHAMMALFALGYAGNIEPEKLEGIVGGLSKRFPENLSVQNVVSQYSQMIAKYKATPREGSVAPDINMPDTSGKMFGLNMLRGKYVLLDFWASWCGPCRGENPNIVKAYNIFKDKNFTVLGVSLDRDKASWVNAIAEDNLTWHHISDLKYWNSAAVGLYGFDGIPYNLLIDPAGKIVGSNLMGANLETKLAELLK